MAEGVKLYHEFTSFLKKRSKLKVAWFSTFNFSISFFERYILSALADTDYKSLRSLKDYEALNQRLFGEEGDVPHGNAIQRAMVLGIAALLTWTVLGGH